MLDTNTLLLMAEKEIENTNLFPFPLWLHLSIGIFGFFFMGARFIKQKKPFQLVYAVAIPFSMTIWLSDSRSWFYTLGAIELVLIVLAMILGVCFSKTAAEPEKKSPEKSEEKAPEQEAAPETEENGGEE